MSPSIERRLNTLRNLTPQQIRDVWIGGGRALANQVLPTYYSEGALYRIDSTGTNLDGAIVYCTQRLHDPFPWNAFHILNGVIQHQTTHLIPPQFVLLVLPSDVPDETTVPPIPGYDPLDEDPDPPTVDIPDYELERILLEAGVPFIRFEELEWSKEQIKYLILRPVIEEFYKWFPIVRAQVYSVTTEFSIPFPANANGVKRVLGMHSLRTIFASYQNPFLYAYELTQGAFFGGIPSTIFGSHRYTRHHAFPTMLSERSMRQAILNEFQRIEWRAQERVLKGYYMGGNLLQVEWTYLSDRWEDIPLRRRDEVRKLACARALRAFGMLRSQANPEGAQVIDYQGFLTRADKLEEEVLTAWKEFTKASIIRGR